MTRTLRLPDNVKVFAHDHPETARLTDLGVAIHGQSFARADVKDNLAAAYPPPVSGYTNIGLLHTGLGGMEGHERYAPCTLEELRLRGYDYWALGHIHTRQMPSSDPHVIFAGNVQGRHIREAGPKGCMLVTVGSNQAVTFEFQRLDCVRWERARVELSEIDNESDAFTRVAETFDNLLASEPDPDVMLAARVVLTGSTSLHTRLHADQERLVAEVRALATDRGADRLWIERVELQTRAPQTITIADGPFEELLDVLAQVQADPASLPELLDDLAELKRRLPAEMIHDPESPQLTETDWLRSLLPTVGPLLLDLLGKTSGTPAGNRIGS